MPCISGIIPEYLHTNNRQPLSKESFDNEHKIYRLTKHPNNPIEFPNGTMTALSCKWSFIINEEDVLNSNDPAVWEGFKYSFVEPILAYQLKSQILVGDFVGWHKLTCVLEHTPNECDYSHCEIFIKHDFYNNKDEDDLIDSWFYTYDLWQQNNNALQKGACKHLRKDYRKDLIALFYLPV